MKLIFAILFIWIGASKPDDRRNLLTVNAEKEVAPLLTKRLLAEVDAALTSECETLSEVSFFANIPSQWTTTALPVPAPLPGGSFNRIVFGSDFHMDGPDDLRIMDASQETICSFLHHSEQANLGPTCDLPIPMLFSDIQSSPLILHVHAPESESSTVDIAFVYYESCAPPALAPASSPVSAPASEPADSIEIAEINDQAGDELYVIDSEGVEEDSLQECSSSALCLGASQCQDPDCAQWCILQTGDASDESGASCECGCVDGLSGSPQLSHAEDDESDLVTEDHESDLEECSPSALCLGASQCQDPDCAQWCILQTGDASDESGALCECGCVAQLSHPDAEDDELNVVAEDDELVLLTEDDELNLVAEDHESDLQECSPSALCLEASVCQVPDCAQWCILQTGDASDESGASCECGCFEEIRRM